MRFMPFVLEKAVFLLGVAIENSLTDAIKYRCTQINRLSQLTMLAHLEFLYLYG